MITPSNLPEGKPFVSTVLAKIREILAYLNRSKLIAGNGVTLRETSVGVIVSAKISKNTASATQAGFNSMFTVSIDSGYVKITDPENSDSAGFAVVNGTTSVSCQNGSLQASAGYLSLVISMSGSSYSADYQITASIPVKSNFQENSGFFPLAQIYRDDNEKWQARQLSWGIVPQILITGECEEEQEE